MALLVRVYASGEFVFVPALDRGLDVSLVHKEQQDVFTQYIQTRHPLPPQLYGRLQESLHYATCLGLLQWCCCCFWCCDTKSWDMDRDVDMLLQHIRGQLTGILEPQQYEMTEHISVNASWEEGRAVLKLWLKDPMRYEA